MNRPLAIALLGMLPSLTAAQGTSSGVAALKIPFSARIAALGAAAVTDQQTIASGFVNPASAWLPGGDVDIVFTHNSWVQGTRANALAVGFPLPFGRMLLATSMTSVDGIEVRDRPGPPSTTFSARTAVIRGGWSTDISGGILLGVSASYIYDKLYASEATGVGFDAGLVVPDILPSLTAGASVTQAGTVSGYTGSTANLPMAITLGAAYSFSTGDLDLAPTLAWQTVRNGASGVTAGFTAQFMKMISLAASFRTGETARKAGMGLGVRYGGMELQYTIQPLSEGLGTGQIVSLGVRL